MAYTTINKSGQYFNTVLYAGTGGNRVIDGVGFQPDWIWIKQRDNGAYSHMTFDAVRGVGKALVPDTDAAESNQSNGVSAFSSDGYSLGDFSAGNYSSRNYAAWHWRAGGGAGSSNTDGSINTTSTSVSTTGGFSISKYTGTGSNATVGHGLGVAPKMILFKRLDNNDDWTIYHNEGFGATKKIDLNNTGAASAVANVFNNTDPTASVMSVGTNGRTNASGGTYLALAFAEIRGYSRFGTYTGNGNNDGPMVYTGFAPAFVIQRDIDNQRDWTLVDSKRDPFNPRNDRFTTNESSAEVENNAIDLLSHGFKVRQDQTNSNAAGQKYLYMAFGQSLIGTNGCVAPAQ